MREIKFKAYDKLNDRIIGPNISIDFIHNQCYIFDESFKRNPTFINDFIPLQYIGLKDKNNIEIYEGDLIKDDRSLIDGIYEIKYNKNKAAFTMSGWTMPSFSDKHLEIVGNIYENHELLEEH